MRTFLIALASALLLTYLVVESLSKFFPGETGYLILGSALAIALFMNGLFNARLYCHQQRTQNQGQQRAQSKPQCARQPSRQRAP